MVTSLQSPRNACEMKNQLSWTTNVPVEPKHEGKRRTTRLQVPLHTSVAIRRLHRQFGHVPNSALVQLLGISGTSSDYIEVVANYRCDSCERHKQLAQTHKVALPKKVCFNHEIGIDCVEVKDNSGERYTFLNIVCQSATLQRVTFVKNGGGTPSSRACLAALQQHWCA
eukprot:2038712-Pyramimonas_sp.AAC.1